MLEGKRFFPETGIPILKIALKMVLLAVELPDPFLVPTIIEKSLITLSMILLNGISSLRRQCNSARGNLLIEWGIAHLHELPHLSWPQRGGARECRRA